MAGSEPFITTLSTKGQVILPKAIRRAMRRKAAPGSSWNPRCRQTFPTG